MKLFSALLISALPFTIQAQQVQLKTTPDSSCIVQSKVYTDSLARMHISTINNNILNLTAYQQRAYSKLSQLFTSKCVNVTLDTIVVSPPPPPAPVETLTIALTATSDTIWKRGLNRLPTYGFVKVNVISSLTNSVISDSAAFTISDTTARIWWNKTQRRLEIYNVVINDTATVTARYNNATKSHVFILKADTGIVVVPPPPPPPPVDTVVVPPVVPPAPTPIPLGNLINVNPSLTHQVIIGWEGSNQNGWFDCNRAAFVRYKDELTNRLINELGITRVLLPLRTGTENTRDYFLERVAGTITREKFDSTWFWPVNDNTDPLVTDSSKFKWGFLDGNIDNAILPLKNAARVRGDSLYVTLTVIDFKTTNHDNMTRPFDVMRNPEEYAELVTMTFVHMKQKYGFVPDALEILLEPEHTPYYAPDLARAIIATVNRLQAKGFAPHIIAPSTTSMLNAHVWYEQMLQVPGLRGKITELSYHRYVAVSDSSLQKIGAISLRDGVKTSMLEHISSGFDALYSDLTVGRVSAWHQYSSAFCGMRDNPSNGGVYYQINQVDSLNPKINITDHSKTFRQVFNYVRPYAVRIDALSGNALLKPLAFRNKNGKLVVVVQMKESSPFTVQGLTPGIYGINYSTHGTANWNVELPTQTNSITIPALPINTVVTIYQK